jgi:hypothetical protein
MTREGDCTCHIFKYYGNHFTLLNRAASAMYFGIIMLPSNGVLCSIGYLLVVTPNS